MNCKQCNEKLALFSSYCENCSAKGPSFGEWWQFIGASSLAFLKKRIWLTATLIGILILSIGGGILWSALSQIDPSDYVVTYTSGFDNNGYIQVGIDYDALCEKVIGPKPDKETKKGYEQYSAYMEKAETLQSTLRVAADRTAGLKNGDYYIVTVQVLDPTPYEDLGVKLKKEVYQKTLQIGENSTNFDTPVEVDLFEYIDTSFNGTNGSGYFVLSDENKETSLRYPSGYTVTLRTRCYETWGGYRLQLEIKETYENFFVDISSNKNSGLNNGDTLVLMLDESSLDALLSTGIKAITSSKTYQVTGLK